MASHDGLLHSRRHNRNGVVCGDVDGHDGDHGDDGGDEGGGSASLVHETFPSHDDLSRGRVNQALTPLAEKLALL